MRLIDADALNDSMYHEAFETDSELQKWDSGCWIRYKMFENHLDMAPTADAVPVVRGEWIMDTDPDDGDCRCSSCKVCINALHKRNHGVLNVLGFKLHTFYKYCPNCGAKMESERM